MAHNVHTIAHVRMIGDHLSVHVTHDLANDPERAVPHRTPAAVHEHVNGRVVTHVAQVGHRGQRDGRQCVIELDLLACDGVVIDGAQRDVAIAVSRRIQTLAKIVQQDL